MNTRLKIRYFRENLNGFWMMLCLLLVILLPIGLCIGLWLKSSVILKEFSFFELFLSSEWAPYSGKFGFLSFIISSAWVTILSVLIAVPICLLSAIYLTQYANKKLLDVMHPVIDILAGIPSVVYGVWGILLIVPFISKVVAPAFGIQTAGYTLLTAAIVLSVMIIPFVLNILIEIFKAIPQELTEASLSLGATYWQTIKLVLLKKAFPGIISAVGLGVSRSFGETMAVLMVAGNVAKIPQGPFSPGYPLPALIANNYGEMMSIPMYDSALLLAALILFVIVLVFNLLSRLAIIRYQKRI